MDDFFIFNEIKSTDKNVFLKDYTISLFPTKKKKFIDVPHMNGSYGTENKAKNDVFVNCKVSFIGSRNEIHTINTWLSGRGELRFWDMTDKYYVGEVVDDVVLSDVTKWQEFNLLFRCEPLKYGDTKMLELTADQTFYNLATAETKAIITIPIANNLNHIEIINQNTGELIYIKHAFHSGDEVVIDFVDEYITKNGYSIMKDLHLESDFFDIGVGENRLTSNVEGTIKYTERWL